MNGQFTNRLADARKAAGMTQQDVAEKLECTIQAYQNYEYGKRDVKGTVLAELAKLFGCTVNYLLGLDNDTPRIRPVPGEASLPLVGSIAAGTPREAMEFDGERCWASPGVVERHPNAFFLRVSGDSMNLMYPDGCLVAVDPDECEIESGKVYAVLVNGCDATLKQVFKAGDTIVLHPVSANPAHRDLSIDVTDPDAPYFRVVGRAIWFQADITW